MIRALEHDEVRTVLYQIRDAYRETPGVFATRIIDESEGSIVWTWRDVRAAERGTGPHWLAVLFVRALLRARELGRLALAKPDDALTLERWLAARESA